MPRWPFRFRRAAAGPASPPRRAWRFLPRLRTTVSPDAPGTVDFAGLSTVSRARGHEVQRLRAVAVRRISRPVVFSEVAEPRFEPAVLDHAAVPPPRRVAAVVRRDAERDLRPEAETPEPSAAAPVAAPAVPPPPAEPVEAAPGPMDMMQWDPLGLVARGIATIPSDHPAAPPVRHEPPPVEAPTVLRRATLAQSRRLGYRVKADAPDQAESPGADGGGPDEEPDPAAGSALSDVDDWYDTDTDTDTGGVEAVWEEREPAVAPVADSDSPAGDVQPVVDAAFEPFEPAAIDELRPAEPASSPGDMPVFQPERVVAAAPAPAREGVVAVEPVPSSDMPAEPADSGIRPSAEAITSLADSPVSGAMSPFPAGETAGKVVSPEKAALVHQPVIATSPEPDVRAVTEPTRVTEPVGPVPTAIADPPRVAERTSVTERTPDAEPTSAAARTSVAERAPVAEPAPAGEPMSVAESAPAVEPASVAEPAPAGRPTSVAEPTSAAEPTLVAEPIRDTGPVPVAEPTSAVEPLPVVEQLSVAEPVPVSEVTPVAEQVPVTGEAVSEFGRLVAPSPIERSVPPGKADPGTESEPVLAARPEPAAPVVADTAESGAGETWVVTEPEPPSAHRPAVAVSPEPESRPAAEPAERLTERRTVPVSEAAPAIADQVGVDIVAEPRPFVEPALAESRAGKVPTSEPAVVTRADADIRSADEPSDSDPGVESTPRPAVAADETLQLPEPEVPQSIDVISVPDATRVIEQVREPREIPMAEPTEVAVRLAPEPPAAPEPPVLLREAETDARVVPPVEIVQAAAPVSAPEQVADSPRDELAAPEPVNRQPRRPAPTFVEPFVPREQPRVLEAPDESDAHARPGTATDFTWTPPLDEVAAAPRVMSIEPEAPMTIQVLRRAPVPDDDLGSAPVQRSVAAVGSRSHSAPAVTPRRIPALLGELRERVNAIELADVRVLRGPAVSARARRLGARAFVQNGDVHLPDEAGPLDSAETRALLVHELTHVAQQRALGGVLPSEFSEEGRLLEAQAVAAEILARDGAAELPELIHLVAPAPRAASVPVVDGPAADPVVASWSLPDFPGFGGQDEDEPVGDVHRARTSAVQEVEDVFTEEPVRRITVTDGQVVEPEVPSTPERAEARDEVLVRASSIEEIGEKIAENPPRHWVDLNLSQDMELLAARLYDRLHHRLRSDVLVHRERTGTLMDFR
jgi:hypothetical protein